jgi:hypothetical protein
MGAVVKAEDRGYQQRELIRGRWVLGMEES